MQLDINFRLETKWRMDGGVDETESGTKVRRTKWGRGGTKKRNREEGRKEEARLGGGRDGRPFEVGVAFAR